MYKSVIPSVLVVLTVFHVTFGDREVNEGGVFCKVRGRSGKISIGFRQNVDQDPDLITTDFDELKERDSSGNDVGKTGRVKHSFNTFASQDFQFTDPIDDTIQNISVKSFQFQATLVENAKLTVTVYVFKENGTIEIDDEETNVTRGNVKFSISLENWTFCGSGPRDVSCGKGNTDETGSFIDFVITIKGRGIPRRKNDSDSEEGPMRKKRGKMFELGGNSEVILSNKVRYDNGNWTDMESGYPMIVTRGSKTSFVFRFNRFSQSVFYDPTISASQDDSGDDTGGDTTTKGPTGGASHACGTVLLILSVILVFFI